MHSIAPPLSRQVLFRLLDGRITWTPRPKDGVYEFAGRARFDKLLSGIVVTRRDGVPKHSQLEPDSRVP